MLRLFIFPLIILFFCSNSYSNGIIENKGQVTAKNSTEEILFYTASKEVKIFFLRDRISYVFNQSEKRELQGKHKTRTNPLTYLQRIDMIFSSAPGKIEIEKGNSTQEKIQFIKSRSSTQVNSYNKITYKNIYPSVDLVFYKSDSGLKYDIVVREGGKLSDVKFHYEGMNEITLDKQNKLFIKSNLNTIEEKIPLAYTDINIGGNWKRELKEVKYKLEKNILSFTGTNDPLKNEILVIDPWATYFGGTDADETYSISSDANDNIYITGFTYSLDLPVTTGVQQDTLAGNYDCFISKFNPAGQLTWCTYYGGTSNDFAYGIKIGADSNPIISGYTYSTDLPTAGTGIHADSSSGSIDLFLAKFSANGQLIWATYYGGTGGEFSVGLDINSNGEIITGGFTSSQDLPLMNAYQGTHGGALDIFTGKFNSNGGLIWSTYYGGTDSEDVHSISYDASGNVLIAGGTYSSNFPTSSGAYQTSMAGVSDMYLVKFSTNGARTWATLIGGADNDDINGITCDALDNIYIAGYSMSNDFPVTGNIHQINLNASRDIVVGKISPNGFPNWMTYFGGSGWDVAKDIVISSEGFIYVCGETDSPDFPILGNAFQSTKAAFYDVAYISGDTSGNFLFSSYKGGNFSEAATAIHVSTSNLVTISGNTSSTDFPLLNPYQNTNLGNGETFIWQVDTTQGVFVDVKESKLNETGIFLYPNPANDMVILTGITGKWKLEIIDMTGKIISSEEIHSTNSQVSISTQKLIPGTYSIRLSNREQFISNKLVKF